MCSSDLGDAPQQSCGAVGAQKLRCQVDECCLAARVLHGPFKDNVVCYQVLPFVPMRVESRVVAIDDIPCM